MSNTIYTSCPACRAGNHSNCIEHTNTTGNEFCECLHQQSPLSARDWANIKAQLQFVFLNIEDANDSDLEISSALTNHNDRTMTFAVYRWESNVRKYVANIEMKLSYSDKKGLVIY